MAASLLIVGSDDFCNLICCQIQSGEPLTLEVAPTAEEALLVVQAQQPDVIILQDEVDALFEFCRSIKQQNRLVWIYTLVICDAQSALSRRSGQCLQFTAEALEHGADACIELTLEASSFHDDEKRLLQAQLQAGLRRVRSYRDIARTNDVLSAIALSDPLTELNNRRALEWELPRQIHHARERDIPISVLMLDVDFFKRINDTYGHLVGDRALQLISARLRYNLRFYDTPFRYGGEEFVIILNNTGSKDAKLIGQRLCHLIADQPFAVEDNLDLHITVSAGTASLNPTDDDKGISLLRRADQYLLLAKAKGRNQILSAEDDV
jgi:two-component system cell cycle response regulator